MQVDKTSNTNLSKRLVAGVICPYLSSQRQLQQLVKLVFKMFFDPYTNVFPSTCDCGKTNCSNSEVCVGKYSTQLIL